MTPKFNHFLSLDRALMAITKDGLMPIAQIPGFAACSVFKDLLGERTTKCRTLGGCSLVGDIRGDENIALHSSPLMSPTKEVMNAMQCFHHLTMDSRA